MREYALITFRLDLFGDAYGWEGAKNTISHISCNDETWHIYALSKEDRHFFTGYQQLSLYQEIQKYKYRLHFNV